MEQNFQLPDVTWLSNGKHLVTSALIMVHDLDVYAWVIQPQVPIKREFAFIINGVPGIMPVACCATRWSGPGGGPMFDEHKVYLRAIERTQGQVRVAVEFHGFEPIDIAVGLTFSKKIF